MLSNRPLGRLANAVPAFACLIILACASSRMASAQGIYAVVGNDLITARLGESGTENGGAVTGRFSVSDPRTRATIMYGPTVDRVGVSGGVNVPGSFVTVRIDGGVAGGGQDLIFGDIVTGVWLLPPTELNGKIIARWGTLPGAVALKPVPPIEVTVEISLVHDVVSYRFTIINGIVDTIPPTFGTGAHTVGLRFAQNFAKDTLQFENEGPVILSDGGQVSTEVALTGASVPRFWKVFDSGALNPIGGVLRPTPSDSTFIAPDELLFSSANILSELWDHTPVLIPGFNFTKDAWDAAAAVFFNPAVIAPGASREIITYFGRQDTTIDFTRPWAAGIDARGTLDLIDVVPTPKPTPIIGFVTNQTDVILTNVNATITLPKGLALAAGETATKSSATLDPGGEARFNWSVLPTGDASGRLTYSVAFAAGPGTLGKVITRSIDIPALPTQTFQGGLQMVSFPETFADPTPAAALGLSVNDFGLLRWNPAIGQYQAVSRLVPGEGYWLSLAASKTVTLKNASPIPVGSQPFEIRLQNGWNQIGNPFLRIVNWSDVQVLTSDAVDPNYLKSLSIDQAAAAGLIQSAIFRYDTTDQSYKFDPTTNTDLVPFVGYWVKALKSNVSLLVSPPPISRAARAAVTASNGTNAGTRANNWKLSIIASSAGVTDAANYIGLASNAVDGLDKNDIEKPPAAKQGLSVGLAGSAQSGRAGVLAQDIQQANGLRKTWNLLVTTPTPKQDVTLSWPDISTLPRGYELFITDSATGQRRQMRQTPSMRINTGDASTRAFVITAEPRTGAAVFALNLQTRSSRAANATTIEVGSTQDATLAVRVKGSSGQTIRTLTGRSASLGNSATYVWDNRDAKGSAVAAGAYIIEVTGTTSDGETRRVAQPLVIVR